MDKTTMQGPFEGRSMTPGLNGYAACGHEHPTMREARRCAETTWPYCGTTHARPVRHQPRGLVRVVVEAA